MMTWWNSGWGRTCVVVAAILASASTVWAEEGEDLAKQLANPLASLISVPFQGNYDGNRAMAENG